MPLNENAIRALGQLGYVLRTRELKRFDRMWDQNGEPYFWSFLERERQRRELADRWFPLLESYAAECRDRSPSPSAASFTPVEHEQLRILRGQMIAFVSSPRDMEALSKPLRVALISTPPVGLPAAFAVFHPLGLRIVILTNPEADQWLRANKNARLSNPWWFVHYRWVLRDQFIGRDRQLVDNLPPPPAGTAYWLMTESVALGGAPYSAHHSLWSWSGERAKFVETLAVEKFQRDAARKAPPASEEGNQAQSR
jgi:hypothetical protein